jgi:hypothetical protein
MVQYTSEQEPGPREKREEEVQGPLIIELTIIKEEKETLR